MLHTDALILTFSPSIWRQKPFVQYCAKVMRANFVEIRPLFSRTIFRDRSSKIRSTFEENSRGQSKSRQG